MKQAGLTEYNGVSKFLHWSMAILIFAEWCIGATLDYTEWSSLHFQIGTIILLLVVLRIVWKVITPQPAMDSSLTKLNQLAASMGHGVLYLLMILVPALGLTLLYVKGSPVNLLGFDIPKLISTPWTHDSRHLVKEIHSFFAAVLVSFAGLHGLIAIVHYIRHKTILQRMLPKCMKK